MTRPTAQAPESVSFDLPDVTLDGLRFGPPDAAHKVIALHGWLDNAASFSRLLPCLPEIDCVALDMAGHGRSGHRAGHSAYNIWEDLRDVRQVAARLGWSAFFLLGHSRGAAVATLFAGTFPRSVRGAFLIDGLVPMPGTADQLPADLAKSIEAMERATRTPARPSYFETYEAAADARTRGRFALSQAGARALAERGVRYDAQHGYFWANDQRLKLPSEIRFTLEQSRVFIERLPTPAEVIVASNGVLHKLVPTLQQYPNLILTAMQGDHHLHLLDDRSTRVAIADAFRAYLAARSH